MTKQAVFPVPVPLFVPTPVAMWAAPTPYPIFMPIPIPVPIFIPTTKKSANSIMKHVKEIQEKVPAGKWSRMNTKNQSLSHADTRTHTGMRVHTHIRMRA